MGIDRQETPAEIDPMELPLAAVPDVMVVNTEGGADMSEHQLENGEVVLEAVRAPRRAFYKVLHDTVLSLFPAGAETTINENPKNIQSSIRAMNMLAAAARKEKRALNEYHKSRIMKHLESLPPERYTEVDALILSLYFARKFEEMDTAQKENTVKAINSIDVLSHVGPGLAAAVVSAVEKGELTNLHSRKIEELRLLVEKDRVVHLPDEQVAAASPEEVRAMIPYLTVRQVSLISGTVLVAMYQDMSDAQYAGITVEQLQAFSPENLQGLIGRMTARHYLYATPSVTSHLVDHMTRSTLHGLDMHSIQHISTDLEQLHDEGVAYRQFFGRLSEVQKRDYRGPGQGYM
ncbi:MAG: hypothetical protein JWM56_369 [Candidatus Peribacteria bacterium]|nr:hypothetical protein [Candidatus Peribacteria bacterium]